MSSKSPNSKAKRTPRFRVRYIVALGILAAIVVLNQLLTQVILEETHLKADQGNTMANALGASRELGTRAFSIQSSENALRISTLTNEVIQLHKKMDQAFTSIPSKGSPALVDALKLAETHLGNIGSLVSKLQQAVRSNSIDQANEISRELASVETKFRLAAHEILTLLLTDSAKQLLWLRGIEPILMLLLLSALVLEGLYIFRPAIAQIDTLVSDLEGSRQEAERALKIRSEFLSKMSHEIKNPLNAIIGMSESLSDTKLTSAQSRYSQIIQRSASALRTLTENLLDFSKLEAGKFHLNKAPFSLYAVIESAADIISPQCYEKGLELVIDAPPEIMFRIKGDSTRLQQVLVNLLGNAVKFTESGEITLRVRLQGDGKTLEISVTDSGVGILPEDLSLIFESFQQGKTNLTQRHGGTGLGLTIAKQLVEQMGGRISLSSVPGKGSTFTFTLPQEQFEESKLQRLVAARKLEGTHAIVYTSSTGLRELISTRLQERGAQTSLCATDEAVVSALSASTANNKTLILDGRVFGSSTEILLEQTRALGVGSDRILFIVSPINATEEIKAASSLGINRFLFKPVSPFHTIREVHQLNHSPVEGKTLEPTAEEAPLIQDSRSLKILVADDSEDNHSVIQVYLEDTPYLLEFAKNGLQAVTRAQSEHFDLIFMDIDMPIMDGYEATRKIRESNRKVPIIALSAFEIKGPQRLFFNDVLTKPVARPILLRAILRTTTDSPEKSVLRPMSSTDIPPQLKEKLPAYLERRKKELEGMRLDFEMRRYENLARVGHNLKGTAPTFGLHEIGVIGSALHRSALEKNDEHILAHLKNLENQLDGAQGVS